MESEQATYNDLCQPRREYEKLECIIHGYRSRGNLKGYINNGFQWASWVFAKMIEVWGNHISVDEVRVAFQR